ncbi:MAG: hypothetical protein JXB14_01000 [Candidatus Altiarchaeota archaeon]|nr:hypothetical protein [Candidatus Altiarchaeota archaeon]
MAKFYDGARKSRHVSGAGVFRPVRNRGASPGYSRKGSKDNHRLTDEMLLEHAKRFSGMDLDRMALQIAGLTGDPGATGFKIHKQDIRITLDRLVAQGALTAPDKKKAKKR